MYEFTNGNKGTEIVPKKFNSLTCKRFLKNALAISSAFVVFFNSCPIHSVKAETVGGFIIEGGTSGTDYTYENNVLTIKSSTPMTIKNSNPNTATADRIKIENEADIILAGVNIEADGSPMEIITGTAKIILKDGTDK